jgi:uncharacterized membrane protein
MAESGARRPLRPLTFLRHPIYGMMLPVPIVCFMGALLTDIAYANSDGNLIWLAFSSWLLFAGFLSGALAAVMLLIDFLRSPAPRAGAAWAHLLLFYSSLLVELSNIFIHERDGWTAVVPVGMTLSIIGAVLILIAGWLHRPAVAVAR